MRETWYVLEDGAVVDPNDVAPDESGALRHKKGVVVAMSGQVPVSRGVDDPDAERARAAAVKPKPREAKPADAKPGYTTREAKAG